MKKIAILASGGGTTAESIMDSCSDENVLSGKLEIVGLIASKPGIGAMKKLSYNSSTMRGLREDQIAVVNPKDYATPRQFGEAILKLFKRWDVDLYGQYGWLPKTPKNVTDAYLGLNQHGGGLDPTPNGPYPDFGGQGMIGAATIAAQLFFARRVERPFYAEATCHIVEEEFDTGLRVCSASLLVNPKWSVKQLQAKLLPIEHRAQICALLEFHYRGSVVGRERESRLILPQETALLNWAKGTAKRFYPHG